MKKKVCAVVKREFKIKDYTQANIFFLRFFIKKTQPFLF